MVDALNGDMGEARRFLEHIAPGELVTLQTFDDVKPQGHARPELARILHGGIDANVHELQELQRRGAGVFLMANRGDGKGRAATNVTGVRGLFNDLDGAPLEPVLAASVAAGLVPHAVIESSPGKWHVYWLVSDCALDQFGPLQLALAQRFAGDESVTDLPRVLRVPGFIHQKGQPFRVRIQSLHSGPRYTVQRIIEGLGLTLHLLPAGTGDTPCAAGSKVAPGGRHAHLLKRAGKLNFRGIPAAGVRASLHQINADDCDPPKSPAEVDALVDDVLRRYAGQHGRDLEQQRIGQRETQGVILTRGSDITPEPIRWLWTFWLARGKFQLIAGAPGQGKTTIALLIAATISRGRSFPDGELCAAGSVLIWSGEDDPADTLVPRLMAMGADLSMIHFVSGSRVDGKTLPFDPARDMVQLTEAAARIGDVSLMIVDPVVSAIAGDSHKNAEVRRGLQPLVDLASHLGAAVIGITHLSKGTAGKDPTERVTGSIAFGAVARVVMMVAKVRGTDGTDRRIFVRAKSNIGPDDGGFEYRIEQTEVRPGLTASIVVWGQAVAGTARDLLAQADADTAETGAQASAERFLTELLLTAGPLPVKRIESEAEAAGHSRRTLRRAADALNVSRSKGRGMGAPWSWSLPDLFGPTPPPVDSDPFASG